MSENLHHNTEKGLKHWESVKKRAEDGDTEIFKIFGMKTPYTFERIIEIAIKMIAELEEIKTYQEQ